jgi:NhaA family Na+:H+ antiporter
MSLFIGVLAFPGAIDSPQQIEVKLGVLAGSFLSAVIGAAVLAIAGRRRKELAEDAPDTGR